MYTHIYTYTYTHTHIHLWLIHIIVCQKPTQHCKVIILQWGSKESDMTEHTHTHSYPNLKKEQSEADLQPSPSYPQKTIAYS